MLLPPSNRPSLLAGLCAAAGEAVHCRVSGGEAGKFLVIGLGLVAFAVLFIGAGTLVICVGVGGLKVDGFGIIRDRVAVPAFVPVGKATIVK